MTHSKQIACVLDTNVIFPVTIRNILLWFAYVGLYRPLWSKTIFAEWKRVMERRKMPPEAIARQIAVVQESFPDALVEGYEPIIPCLVNLPDADDKHVLAAAIKAHAPLIVTNNLKHFPEEALEPFDIAAIDADNFLVDQLDLNHELGLEAFRRMVAKYRNPPRDEFDILERMRGNQLDQTANYIQALL